MLTHLNIKNFAVVKSLSIELDKGLTVITGETGAGKSIALDALGLVLGDRADKGVIRDGTDRAEISASFDISHNQAAQQWLDQQGLDIDDCVLRRVLTRDGRSRAFINGSTATLSQLRDFGGSLIDIHSQHEHQSLLDKASHRRLLDSFAGANKLAADVSHHHLQWHRVNIELKQLKEAAQNQTEQHQLLHYQLAELNELDLQTGELGSLEAEQQRLASAGEILNSGQQTLLLIEPTLSDGADCSSLINQAIRLADGIQDQHADLNEARELLQNARIEIDEAGASLNHYLSQVTIDPQRQQLVEHRLSEIYQIARKHQLQPPQLIELKQRLNNEFEQLDNIDEHIEQLSEQTEQYKQLYLAGADQLSAKRRAASTKLDKLIAEQLSNLGMNNCQFMTQLNALDADTLSAHGMETVEFLVSTNPGQSPRPLSKVASGGELSRISLAIQVIGAQASAIPVLVFDEVDVGIGGGTAEVVGRLLRTLGESGQVICVSHQPQVAAQAHQHLSVSKQSAHGQTDSQIALLNEDEKISEIARMLGGIKLTQQTLAHAREMLLGTS